MDEAEFNKRKEKLVLGFQLRLKDLEETFALANNTVEEGDFVTDRVITVKVEKITFYTSDKTNLPMCAYYGPCYTQTGEPYKQIQYANIYQENILHIKKGLEDGDSER